MNMFSGLLVGAVFGFALHRGGLTRYSRILGTLLLRDFKAMNFMFTGLAVAAILYGVFDLLNLGILPRVNGYFGAGHLIGGVLFGTGMAIAGLCPGTCAARFSSGKLLTGVGLLGIFIGVFVYDFFFPTLSNLGGEQRFITWAMILNVRYGYLAIIMGVGFLAMCFMFDKIDPSKKLDADQKDKPLFKREWGWLSTGTIAGLCIFASAALGEYLSFSGGFLSLGAHIASFFGHTLQSVPTLSETTEWRAMLVLGLFPGTFLSSYMAGTIWTKEAKETVTPLFKEAFGANMMFRGGLVFSGGFLMIVGALIGGGCTTGAFMSAWPTLSVGSFVMGGTFFLSAMAAAHILYLGKYRMVLGVKQELALNLAND